MHQLVKFVLVLFIGCALGAGVVHWQSNDGEASVMQQSEDKPLYWVAPMDASYRRDGPGKSPMGMDLVPVYEEAKGQDDPGAVWISPSVVNNLGVRTQTVELKPFRFAVQTIGYVQYDENNLVHIHPRVDGWIEDLYVTAAGDPVEKGQPLYSLYAPQLVNAQEEYLIALRRNNPSLIAAATARLKSLQMSQRFIDDLKSKMQLQQTVTFYAPQSGVVDGLKIREGFFVQPGNTLMSIGQLDQVWVEAEVFERDASLMAVGLEVSMSLDFLPGKVWSGKVDYVYPTLDASNRTLRVRLRFNNPDKLLKPNMFANVSIFAEATEPQLVIPAEALIRTGKQNRVVLARGKGEFKSIAVTPGQVMSDQVVILAGLEQGDEVVTSAQFLIDSESSKASDFKRMSPVKASTQETYSRATVAGTINQIDMAQRVLNISRQAIEKWQRPAATMDFMVDEIVSLNSLKVGQEVMFTFEVRDDLYIIEISPTHDEHRHQYSQKQGEGK